MDLTQSIAPRSDQQNFDDYAHGPRTVTVTQVKPGSAEQPVEVHLVEFPGRPYKPSKTMRRVLVACWGADSNAYAGRRITLVGDPKVKFGGSTVGGIKIAALSHITKSVTLSLTETKGKRAPHTVQPLADPAPAPAPAPVDPNAARIAELRAEWNDANEDRRAAIKSEVDALKALTAEEPGFGAES